jgi:hypothetical protein
MRPIPIALAAVLAACATRGVAAPAEVPARWGAYSVDLVDDAGRPLPTFEHRGRTYVLGTLGQRYLLRIRNGSGRRVEVVASVDGRDVVDGRPAAFGRRGYVVAPYGELAIDGYRLDASSVAAFRFSSVPRSYAARKGDARDVGVIGVAVFPERWPRPAPPYRPPYQPYPSPAPEAPERGGEGAAESRGDAPAAPPGAKQAAPEALAERGRAPSRPGLGTEFGERHSSHVEEVSFERASDRPEAVLTVRYDDRPGLVALGIDVDRERWARGSDARLRETSTPFRSEPGYCEPPPGWGVR